MNEPGKTAVLYARVSTKEQVEGSSLEMQERLLREYASRNQIKVLGVYIDKGESAKTTDRKEFQKALTFCTEKKGRVDYFLVYKIDRFSRNVSDHLSTRAILQRAGTQLVSLTETFDSSPQGEFSELVMSGVAQYDNRLRADRSKAGMLEHLRQGIWVWAAPWGYRRIHQGANLSPDPATAPFIKMAFEEWATGQHTYRSLAKLLSDKGFRSKTGKKPTAQHVEHFLKNKIYAGTLCGFGQEFPADFEAIISEELFEKCNPSKRQSGKESHRSFNPMFPLRKFIACSDCRGNYTASISRGVTAILILTITIRSRVVRKPFTSRQKLWKCASITSSIQLHQVLNSRTFSKG